MKPKIGYSVLDLKKFSKENFPFETYELRASSVKPNIKIILDLKEKFNGEELSLHSGLSKIFSCRKYGYEEFSNSELNILRYEIMISKIIGIKRINFHMTNHELTDVQISKFKEIIEFAKEEGIELIYENHVCSARAILYIAEKFPELRMCIDLGHLNIAITQNAFGMDLDEFFEKIKDRVIHVHAHNNNGERDSHQGITKGTFDWKNALNKLVNLEKVIVEVKGDEDAMETKRILDEFFE